MLILVSFLVWSGAQALVSDEFYGELDRSVWQYEGSPDVTLVSGYGKMWLTMPGDSVHDSTVMQNATNEDFGVEAEWSAEGSYGLIVRQSPTTFLRFGVVDSKKVVGTFVDRGGTKKFCEKGAENASLLTAKRIGARFLFGDACVFESESFVVANVGIYAGNTKVSAKAYSAAVTSFLVVPAQETKAPTARPTTSPDFVSDLFDQDSMKDAWNVDNPDRVELVEGALIFDIPAGKKHDIKLVQHANKTGTIFAELEAGWSMLPQRPHQFHGMIIHGPRKQSVRFGSYVSFSGKHMIIAAAEDEETRRHNVFLDKPLDSAPARFKINRYEEGQVVKYAFATAPKGVQAFTEHFTLKTHMPVHGVGLYAANGGNDPPAFLTMADYFFVLGSAAAYARRE